MRVPFPEFIGGSYKSLSWKASNQRCVNLYLEQDPEKGKILLGTPGWSSLGLLGSAAPDPSVGRRAIGMIATPDALYTWNEKTKIYRTTAISLVGAVPVATTVELPGLYEASDYIIAAQAGDRVMYVNGLFGYWSDRTGPNAFTKIVSAGFPASPQSCDAVDGYFLAHGPNSDQFFWSSPFDPSTWNALDFASAENVNDKLVRIKVLEREVYLIGQTSTEVWAVVGGDEVFDRIQGTYIPYGTPAKLSPATIGQSLLYLSRDEHGGGIVIQVRGLQVSRISTHAIEQEIQSYTRIDDARALVYQQGGHQFYVLTFPTANKTWVYDLSTQLWHERISNVIVGSVLSIPPIRQDVAWVPECHAYFSGYNVVGATLTDRALANERQACIAYLSPSNYQDGGNNLIKRIRTSPHVMSNNDYMGLDAIEFLLQPGVGRYGSFSDADDPQALLRISRDGGQTYGVQRRTTMGAQGEYKTRIKFNRIGTARDFVAELTISSPVQVALTGAYFETSR